MTRKSLPARAFVSPINIRQPCGLLSRSVDPRRKRSSLPAPVRSNRGSHENFTASPRTPASCVRSSTHPSFRQCQLTKAGAHDAVERRFSSWAPRSRTESSNGVSNAPFVGIRGPKSHLPHHRGRARADREIGRHQAALPHQSVAASTVSRLRGDRGPDTRNDRYGRNGRDQLDMRVV